MSYLQRLLCVDAPIPRPIPQHTSPNIVWRLLCEGMQKLFAFVAFHNFISRWGPKNFASCKQIRIKICNSNSPHALYPPVPHAHPLWKGMRNEN